MLKVLLTVFSTVLLLAVAGLGVVLTGGYNVAATEDHGATTEWLLGTLQHRSVAVRAGSVVGSPPTDSLAVARGLEHYDAMCVDCHGAPGVERGALGQGMTPTPPDLAEELHEWFDQELFWITKHGLRLAGMPAFGPTHTDEEIWAIVAFMKEMEQMGPTEYAARVQALEAAGQEGWGGR